MRKYNFLFAVLGVLLYSGTLVAQSTAAKTYYRILSAKPAFADCCIQDNSGNNNGSDDFLITAVNASSLLQQWELIPNEDTTAYYIRNRVSKRYIGTSSVLTGKFYWTQNTISLALNPAWTMIKLKESQVALRTVDEFGVSRFLNAADTTANMPDRISSISYKQNTGFAWIIEDASSSPSGVRDLSKDIRVSVVGRQIMVSGTTDYRVYDSSGSIVSEASALERGFYIVLAEDEAFKIFIK